MQQNQSVVIQQPYGGGGGRGGGGGMRAELDSREWSTGMCGCFEDCCSCIYSCFCFPCFTCTLASEMNECMCGPICFGPLFLIPMRTKVRTMYGIRGSICKDICAMACCEFCVTLQMHREMKNMSSI